MADNKVSIIFELIDKASTGIKSISQTVLNAINPLNALRSIGSTAFDYLTQGIKYSIQAAEESRQALAQTEAVIKSTGGAAGVTAESVSKLANQISLMSSYDDEAVQGAENLLLTFKNVKKDAFEPATQAIVDMSAAMGQDLQSSTIQIGKALNDPIEGLTALKRVGVTFNDTQKEMIKTMVKSGNTMGAQKIILKELNSEFGGSAAAVADPFKQAQNALQNLAESVGGVILPIVSQLARAFAKVADALSQINFQPITIGLQKFLVEVETRLKVYIEIWKEILSSPFRWETYKTIMEENLRNITDFAIAVKNILTNGYSAFQEWRKKQQEQEAKDGLTLEQRIAKIKSDGAEKLKQIDGQYNKTRVKNAATANADIEDDSKKTTNKISKAQEKANDELIANHKSMVENMKARNEYSYQAELTMLNNLLAHHKFTSEQRLALDTQMAQVRQKMRDDESTAIVTAFNNQLAEKKLTGDLLIQDEVQMYSVMLANKNLSESDRKKVEDDYRKVQLELKSQDVEIRRKMENQYGDWFLASINDVANSQLSLQDKVLKTMGGFIRRALEAQLDAWAATESGKAIAAAWAAAVPTFGASLAGLAPQLAAIAAAVVTAKTALNVLNFADGGIVMPTAGGTIARIGEAGSREAVIPLDTAKGRKILNQNGGNSLDGMTVQIVLSDGTSLAKGIFRETRRLQATGQLAS